MERIHRIDPAEDAALKRLLAALVLSLLLHALVVMAGANRAADSGVTASRDHSVSPQSSILSVSLRSVVAQEGFPARMPLQSTIFAADRDGIGAPDTRYYAVAELDVLPVPRNPDRMRGLAPLSGSLRLLVLIDASGRVTDVSVFGSVTSDAQAAAVAGMRSLAFLAARKHGRPVRSEVVIELTAAART